MRTTADERRTAVAVARRLLDTSQPLMLDAGECDLICRTLLDVQAVSLVHAPVISAVKRMHTPTGHPVREYSALHHSELVPAVRELYRFDAKEQSK